MKNGKTKGCSNCAANKASNAQNKVSDCSNKISDEKSGPKSSGTKSGSKMSK